MRDMNDEETKRMIAYNVQRLLGTRTKYWLAKHTGEHESTIGSIVNGKHLCNAGILGRIAIALQVDVSEFYQPIPKSQKKSRQPA